MLSLLSIAVKATKKAPYADSKHFELKTFPYKPRSHVSVEVEFSTAERIVQDTKQSLKLAEALDVETGRTDMSDSITSLLNDPEVCAGVALNDARIDHSWDPVRRKKDASMANALGHIRCV